jgi:hypothetical protein
MKHAMLIVIPILLFSCTLKDNEKLDPRLMIESTLVENQLQVTEFMDSIMYLNTQLFEKGKETEAYANTAKMLLYMNALPIYYFDSFVDKTLSDESISFDSYVDFYIEYFHREIVLRRPESNQRFDKAIVKHLSELQKKKSKKYLMIKKGIMNFLPKSDPFSKIFFSANSAKNLFMQKVLAQVIFYISPDH